MEICNGEYFLSLLHKLIKLPNTVKAGHKHDLLLVIVEYLLEQELPM